MNYFGNFSSSGVRRYSLMIPMILFSFIVKAQDAEPLPKELLRKLSTQLNILKKDNQYLNAELINVFGRKAKGNFIQIQLEIENISNDITNQKLLFNYWHNKYKGYYSLLVSYLRKTINLSEPEAKYLAIYIDQLMYLNGGEIKEIKDKANLEARQFELEQKLQSQTYNLEVFDSSLYSKLFSRLIDSLYGRLLSLDANEKFAFLNNKNYQYNEPFRLNLKMSLKLLPENIEVKIDSGNVKNYSPEFYILHRAIPFDKSPKITVQNVRVNTKAAFNSIRINISGGYCIVHKTKRNIDFAFQNPQSEKVKEMIRNKLIGSDNGRYAILYLCGSINGKSGENIEVRKD